MWHTVLGINYFRQEIIRRQMPHYLCHAMLAKVTHAHMLLVSAPDYDAAFEAWAKAMGENPKEWKWTPGQEESLAVGHPVSLRTEKNTVNMYLLKPTK